MRLLRFSGLSTSGPPNSSPNCTFCYKPGKPESLPPVRGAAPVGKSQSKWWRSRLPGCLHGPPWSLPRVLPAGVAASGGESEQGKEEGWQSRTDWDTFLCVSSGPESPAPEQPGTLQARHLPLGTEASLFPPCRLILQLPGEGRQAAVFATDKCSVEGSGPSGLLALPLLFVRVVFSHPSPQGNI